METNIFKLKIIEMVSLNLFIMGILLMQNPFFSIGYFFGFILFTIGVFIWFYKEEIVNKEKNNGN